MHTSEWELKDGRTLAVREANPEDAGDVLSYLEEISAQSDFLSFGPGEFGVTLEEEKDFLKKTHESENSIYLIGLIGSVFVSGMTFEGEGRPRYRHTGEFGITVHRDYWGLGIGSAMLDALISWARGTNVITKVNLRVRTDNDRAIALYHGKGFVREGRVSREMRLNGVYYDDYCMGLEL